MIRKLSKMKTKKNQQPLDYCLNCNNELAETDAYCSSCGQRTRESRISFWNLISEFFRTVLNIDSKFFKSLRYLFFPSRLPREYMSGKRLSFINPPRFFFVSLIIHFGLLTIVTKNTDIGINGIESTIIDEIRKDADHAELHAVYDSLILNYPLANSSDSDSLKEKLLGTFVDPKLDSVSEFTLNIGRMDFGAKFAKYDLINLNSDEFADKYSDDNFFDRIFVRQVHRSVNDTKGAIRFLIGNFLWVVVLLAFFTALFLKVLYIRRPYFMVDHLVMSLFIYSFLLLTLSGYYLFEFILFEGDGHNSAFGIIALIAIPLYGLISMKRYYQQGWIKTILKFLMLGFYQLFILCIFILFVGMISLLIY